MCNDDYCFLTWKCYTVSLVGNSRLEICNYIHHHVQNTKLYAYLSAQRSRKTEFKFSFCLSIEFDKP